MIGERSGRPPNAVLCVELGRQGPSSESVVKPLLSQPGCEFAISVEAEAWAHMSNDVVDSPKPVVRATAVAAQQRVTPVALPGARGDLQHPVSPCRADQLIVGIVGAFTEGELNPKPAKELMIRIRQSGENPSTLSRARGARRAPSDWSDCFEPPGNTRRLTPRDQGQPFGCSRGQTFPRQLS